MLASNSKEETMNLQVDYLIIGQGLCGTWLSWYLTKENRTFIVIDKDEPTTPSKVSAGIINPVTGRRMVRVWMAEQVLSFAHEAYHEIGNFLDVSAISQKNIIDFFPNTHQRQVFLERIKEGEEYLDSFPEQNRFNSFFNYDLGCGEIRHSYIAHVETLLPAWRQFLKNNGRLFEQGFEFENLVIKERSVQYGDIVAEKIIFCDGLSSFENPFFKQLPFAPNKGEALIVEILDLPDQHIYKKGFLLAPLAPPLTPSAIALWRRTKLEASRGQGMGVFWLGSNYQWSFPHTEPTREFCEQAERHLKAWLKIPFKILEHRAALRPATLERRPFVGLHPQQKHIGILNGMGTKGCSLAPYFAHQFVNHLLYGTEIAPEADIKRFSRMLSRQ